MRPELKSHYRERRSDFGDKRYGALGISRRLGCTPQGGYRAQMTWSVYRRTVAEALSPPEGLILYCGMSIGYEDVTVDYARPGRAPLDETVTFVNG